ncbi:hypothetical protein OG568_14140 [Streptomyces sp. NBC_01450]|uniref:hypothetical protein n=1 Tax=Streptomyces sp. NBC_01450 TaxID=2903871 RepID=UPI002E2EDE22|nr:hypothetical protein [Streptomyces sp. NBC_01450]
MRDRGKDDITAGERGLFDQILTGDTRRHLASRVAVRLVWQVDPALSPGTRAPRDLLPKDPIRLTHAAHEALHRFFRERIGEARASQTAGSREEQLAQVLDYTAWHQFVVRFDRAG